MNGIFLEKRDDNLIMVATDGRRLAFISRKIALRMDNLKGIILPPKILTIVRKLSSGGRGALHRLDGQERVRPPRRDKPLLEPH